MKHICQGTHLVPAKKRNSSAASCKISKLSRAHEIIFLTSINTEKLFIFILPRKRVIHRYIHIYFFGISSFLSVSLE